LIQILIPSQINLVHSLVSLFLRSVLILSTYLCVVLRWCLSASSFPISSVPCVPHASPCNFIQSAPPVVIMKNSVNTPLKTRYISVTKNHHITLFREIKADYCDANAKYINTLRAYCRAFKWQGKW
jgi:hypothetical protein